MEFDAETGRCTGNGSCCARGEGVSSVKVPRAPRAKLTCCSSAATVIGPACCDCDCPCPCPSASGNDGGGGVAALPVNKSSNLVCWFCDCFGFGCTNDCCRSYAT